MRQVRAKYIEAFTHCLAQRQAKGEDAQCEIRFELDGPKRHELYRILVIDAIQKHPDGAIAVIAFNTSPIVAAHPGLPIASPIAWQAVTFRCSPCGFPEPALLAWGNRWIHDEAPLGPRDGLTGIIHSVSQPELQDGLLEFTVDFGTAPFEAFEELTAFFEGHVESVITYREGEG